MAAAKPTILVIDDDSEIRYSLSRVLSSRDYTVTAAASGEEARRRREEAPRRTSSSSTSAWAGWAGIETLQHIRSINPAAAGHPHDRLRHGADGHRGDEVRRVRLHHEAVRSAEGARPRGERPEDPRRPARGRRLQADASTPRTTRRASSAVPPAMQEVFKTIGQVTASDVTVMITGESGTGKELVARSIFKHSHRAAKAVHRGQLRGDPREPDRERAVRAREGLLHRRDRPAHRQVRALRRRHDLPRRDRRHGAGRRRPRSCGCCRRARSSASAAPRRSRWTSA